MNSMKQGQHSKRKYIILNIFLVLVLIFTYLLINFSKEQYIRAYSQHEHEDKINDFKNNQEKAETQLEHLASILSANETIKHFYLKRDREGLYRASKKYFYDLLDKKQIDKTYFVDIDGKAFLRTHNRYVYGDNVLKPFYEQAYKAKKGVAALGIGKAGLALRAAAPYFSNEKLVGYIEIGQSLEYLISLMPHANSNYYYFVMNKDKLKKSDLSFTHDSKYSGSYLIKNNLIFYKTQNPYFGYIQELAPEIINEVGKDGKVLGEIKLDNKIFTLGIFPLIDASGRQVAQVFYLQDISEFYRNYDFIKYVLLLFSFISFGIILVISNKLTNISNKNLFEKNLVDIIENSWNEVIIMGADDFKYLYLNKKALSESGYQQEEIVGQPLSIISATSPEVLRKTIKPLYSGESKTVTYETIRIRRDSSTYPVRINMQMMEFFGKTVLVGVCEDISKRKESEKLKNEFISMVSHELRTPLTSIMGVLGLLLNINLAEKPEKTNELLHIANNNSIRLLNLVNDILDMQKIDAGKIDFNLSKINLNGLIKSSIKLNNGYAEKYRVSLNFISESEDDIFINADKDRFSQSLANLISNAIKFSPANEAVTVTLKKLDNMARVCVEDKGKGIPERERSKIFRKFSQLDSSDTRSKDGTGLGLYITKHLIEQMNGKIDFESTVDKGTCFFIDFPIEP